MSISGFDSVMPNKRPHLKHMQAFGQVNVPIFINSNSKTEEKQLLKKTLLKFISIYKI